MRQIGSAKLGPGPGLGPSRVNRETPRKRKRTGFLLWLLPSTFTIYLSPGFSLEQNLPVGSSQSSISSHFPCLTHWPSEREGASVSGTWTWRPGETAIGTGTGTGTGSATGQRLKVAICQEYLQVNGNQQVRGVEDLNFRKNIHRLHKSAGPRVKTFHLQNTSTGHPVEDR